jgi:hypothetical protein
MVRPESSTISIWGYDMSIQDWAAIAEIVSAVAVVASLVYLAVQIRQNTHGLSMNLKATELAAFERNVEAGNRIREIFILNPEVSALYMRGMQSYVDLDENDKMRFGLVLSNVFSAMQGAYIRNLTYGNDPANIVGIERLLDSLIAGRGVRDWLSRNEPDWRPQFAELVKRRLQQIDEEADGND